MQEIPWELMFALVYGFLCACFVAPPHEFVAAGLTVQNLFSGALGNEQVNFVIYHIKRTSLTIVIHSSLPLGYFMIVATSNPEKYIGSFLWLPTYWQIGMVVAIALPLSACLCALYWSIHGWSYHPIACALHKLAPATLSTSDWRAVAASINMELRRPDRFSTGYYSRQLYVSENWIVQVGTYNLAIAHQRNVVLNLHESRELGLAYDSPHGIQLLTVDVIPIEKKFSSFLIRLDASDYKELKDRLQAPVLNARNVVIKQTISDRFIAEFTAHIENNTRYHERPADQEAPEPCIGCMQEPACIKLVKLCGALDEGECQQCYCRPLWCSNCMAKWFCSRQDQATPNVWLSGKAPCPMCRARFCMADICLVDINTN